MIFLRWIAVCAALTLSVSVIGQDISQRQLMKDVYYLASDDLEGRATGTLGEQKAAEYIQLRFKFLGLEPVEGRESLYHPFTFDYSSNPHGGADAESVTMTGINVYGYLDNGSDRTVVIGAHYDHLGVGEFSSRDPENIGRPHVGADDNASGVAGVLALAEYFSQNNVTEQVNFLFVCFSGEELGLLGSKAFVEQDIYPIDRVTYMLNMDMIGRLNEDNKLHIHGYGTSPTWGEYVQKVNADRFDIVIDSSGIGPSDFTSFYLADIPVLHFYTGGHSDYHTTRDTPEKINYEGQKKVLNYIADLVNALDDEPKLAFTKTRQKQQDTPRFKVTLGVMPDYSWSKGGLKLDAVTEGRPAAKAGIVANDIILSIGETEIKDIQDYMKILSQHEKGEIVDAVVKRGDDILTVKLKF